MASSDTATAPSHAAPARRVIAADHAVDMRPWTIGAFDAGGRKPAPRRMTAEHLPTADEVAAMESSARDDGYRAGLAEARAGNERIATMVDRFGTAIGRMEREMAQAVLQLAVDLARQVVRETIAVRPEILVPLVHDALAGIARTADAGAVHVHPADLPIVEERIGDALAHAGWKPFADESIERGGCRLAFSGGEVDATVATRWSRVMAQLERDDAWLA